MKKYVSIALVIGALLASSVTYSQTNWVRCKQNGTGVVQSFPGMVCPVGWYQV